MPDIKIEFTEASKKKAGKLGNMAGKTFIDHVDAGMKRVMELLLGEVRKNLSGRSLNVRSGELRSSFQTKTEQREGVVVGRIGSNLVYAKIHEEGGYIHPKNSPFLVFQIGGRTIFAKEVYIPPRPYLKLAVLERKSDMLKVFEFGIMKALNMAMASV